MTSDGPQPRTAQSPAEGYIQFRNGVGYYRRCCDSNDSDQRLGLSADSIQATELLIEALRSHHNRPSDLLAAMLAAWRDECQRGTEPLSSPLRTSGAPGQTDTPD